METVRTQTTQRKRWLKAALYLLAALLLGMGVFIGGSYWELHRSNGEVLTGGQKRAYLLHVPKKLPTNRPVPLVICLHVFAVWPAHVMRLSHWNQLADEFGFLVVYPRGSGFPFRWRCGGSFGRPEGQVQDVQFISDLIDQLQREYQIDETRIYANGLSNGGGMAFLLAASYRSASRHSGAWVGPAEIEGRKTASDYCKVTGGAVSAMLTLSRTLKLLTSCSNCSKVLIVNCLR